MFSSDVYIKELFFGFIGGWVSHYVCQRICCAVVRYQVPYNCRMNNRRYSTKMSACCVGSSNDYDVRDYNTTHSNDSSNEKKSLHMIIATQTDTISYLCKNILSKEKPVVYSENKSGDVSAIPPKTDSLKNEQAGVLPPVRVEEVFPTLTLTPSAVKIIPTKLDNELASMFEEEHKSQSRTMKETLDIGRKVGEEPTSFYSSSNGNKYATLGEVKKSQEISEKFHSEKKINRSDELEIIHAFNNIRGMNYSKGMDLVKTEGYSLHPVYINRGNKNPRKMYSGVVIGVSIEDSEYDYIKNQPSKNAVITSIVDIGGQDSGNRSAPSNL
jgi:hypothetical protein